jgi:fructose-1,6-bisphosphatase I
MAFIMEQAGGSATTGTMNILDIIPENIHQRTPIFLGSKDDIEDVIQCFKQFG